MQCKKYGVDLIFLVAPTTTDNRMDRILNAGSGFIYIVARLGVTGVRVDIAESTNQLLARVKTDLPRAVGFGVSKGAQAAELVRSGADGVIVGSAFVDIIGSGDDIYARVEKLARELKEGIKKGNVKK